MASILVTGGAGFIGSHVARELLRRGHGVTVLDDLSGGFRDNVPAEAEFVHGSILDERAIARLFAARRFEHVFHLAAYAAEGLSHFIKRFSYENNVIGSVTLINAALNTGVKGFVYTSSIAVYGLGTALPMSEDGPTVPADPYGIAKLAVERELQATRDVFGLDFIVFRPHNVYGPGQNIGDRYRNVIGIFMNQILQGLPMTIFGDGTQSRAFTYIGDVAPVLAESIEHAGAWNQTFNVGADEPTTLNDLAERVAAAMGVAPQVVHLEARHEAHHAVSSHARLREVFGERPRTPLDDGLARMAQWVRQHGARQSAPFGRIEVRRNLPRAWADT